MASLTGKVALVTGASRGIGRAIAERLGQEGANVVVSYAGNRDKAEEVVSKIQNSGSKAIAEAVPKAVAIQADIRQIDQVRSLFRQTLDHFGKLDILVNNAAGQNIFKPTAEMTEDEYDSMFDIVRFVG